MKLIILSLVALTAWGQYPPSSKDPKCIGSRTTNCSVQADTSGNVAVGSTMLVAAGDGTTDARPTIQAAIAAVSAGGGGTVQLTGGTYLLKSGAVKMLSGVTLRGTGKFGGSKVKVANKVQSALTANADIGQASAVVADVTGFYAGQNVTIFDSGHTGYGLGDTQEIQSVNTGTNTLTFTANLAHSFTTAASGVVFTSFSAIQGATSFSYGATCGAIAGVGNWTVENLEVDGNRANQTIGNYDCVQAGIELANSDGAVVQNTYVHDVVFTGILADHYISGGHDGGLNQLIANNYLTGISTAGRGLIHLHGSGSSQVVNNTVKNSVGGAIYCYACDYVAFAGNILSGSDIGYYLPSTVNSTIVGGIIKNITTVGVDLENGANNNIVQGVQVDTTGGIGIFANTYAYNNVIQGNVLVGCGDICIQTRGPNNTISGNQVPAQSAGADAIANTGAGATITGNVLYKTGYGSVLTNTGAGSVLGNNIVVSNNRAGIVSSGNGSVIVGNVITTSGDLLTLSGTGAIQQANIGNGAIIP